MLEIVDEPVGRVERCVGSDGRREGFYSAPARVYQEMFVTVFVLYRFVG